MRHLDVFSALPGTIFLFFARQLRAVEIEKGVFYFIAFINVFAAVTELFKNPDLLSAPAGSRVGGLKPQSG